MVRFRRTRLLSCRDTAGAATMHMALVMTPGAMMSGIAIPLSSPNCAVAADAVSPDCRRHSGSSTAVSIRRHVWQRRETAVGADNASSSWRKSADGTPGGSGARRRNIIQTQIPARIPAKPGSAARMDSGDRVKISSSTRLPTNRTTCSLHSHCAGVSMSPRP